MVVVRAELEP
jgi:hypothetical protein